MSALPIPIEPTVRPQRPLARPHVSPRRRRAVRPIARPRGLPKHQFKSLEKVMERTFIFCGFTIATFMVSSLVGHVMVEKSRREGLAALSRLREARKAESVLQERVYALSNVESVQAWALEHGFKAPEDAMKSRPESTLVARR